MIVKTLQLRKNLKQLLASSYTDDLFLDYYGELFRIEPVRKETKGQTQAQKIIEYFSKFKPLKLMDPIFDEEDPAQEKANFRKLRYKLDN